VPTKDSEPKGLLRAQRRASEALPSRLLSPDVSKKKKKKKKNVSRTWSARRASLYGAEAAYLIGTYI